MKIKAMSITAGKQGATISQRAGKKEVCSSCGEKAKAQRRLRDCEDPDAV